MRRIKNIFLSLCLAAALLFSGKTKAQETDYKAYTLFVYNFMKYIEWPEASAKGDFVVGVMGDSPIFNELQTLAKTKKARGRNIVVKKIATADDANSCHLVYIAPSKSSQLKTIKEKVKGKPVLLVGEREGLAEKGAALSFVTLEDDMLKFDINKNAIEQQNLKIPSSLIALGVVVR